MVCDPEALKGDARHAFDDMPETIPREVWKTAHAWQGGSPTALSATPAPCVVVDGLLGIGAKDAPDAIFTAAIRFVNSLSRHALVLSVDVPSGMIADTGETPGACVLADLTLAISAPKLGFVNEAAHPWLGHVAVADIGVPREWQAPPGETSTLACAPGLSGLFAARRYDAHKGMFGRVLVIGGTRDTAGASILAARAALLAGAGVVTFAGSLANRDACLAHYPEIITAPLDGTLQVDKFQSIVIGPGMGATESTRRLVAHMLEMAPCPLVLDADALNVLPAELPRPGRIVITPHPGEAARLLGQSIQHIVKYRTASATMLVNRLGCVSVLKGAGTLIAEPGGGFEINLTGNPGMAAAGSGDVLAGITGALLARGIPPFGAARLAVWLHGTAGDFTAWKTGQESLAAGDIPAALPEAFSILRAEGAHQDS
jgi:NAD(P)H-hydrate epimerase